MSIGLFTFTRLLNYGGVLQGLALHDTIDALTGKTVETLNAWMDPRDHHLLGKVNNPNLSFIARWRNRQRACNRPFGQAEYEVRRQKTIQLLETRLNLSKREYRRPQDFKKLPAYDTVVVGSDQVWNSNLVSEFKTNPWLTNEFPKNQERVAYAASFGVTSLPEALVPVYRAGLCQFRAVTLREALGCRLFDTILRDVVYRPMWWTEEPVLDPTLLRTREQWQDEIKERPVPEGEYLLCYLLSDVSAERIAWLRQLSQTHNLSVVLLVSRPVAWLPENEPWLTVCFDADPLDFVALIAHAAYVVTDSFHGFLFSTIFQKRIAAYQPFTHIGTSVASRFFDFCKRYGATEALHDLQKICESSPRFFDLARIDHALLAHERTRSLTRLKAMLGIHP